MTIITLQRLPGVLPPFTPAAIATIRQLASQHRSRFVAVSDRWDSADYWDGAHVGFLQPVARGEIDHLAGLLACAALEGASKAISAGEWRPSPQQEKAIVGYLGHALALTMRSGLPLEAGERRMRTMAELVIAMVSFVPPRIDRN